MLRVFFRSSDNANSKVPPGMKKLLSDLPDRRPVPEKPKVKTVCLFSGDITRCGGTERISILLANELVRRNDIRVMFLSVNEQAPETFFPLDPRVERFVLYRRKVRFAPHLLPMIVKLHSFLKRQRVDVLIDVDVILSAVSVFAVTGTACRLISWEHFHYEENLGVKLRSFARNLAKRHASAIVVLSEDDKRQYMKHRARVPVVAIPNAIEENVHSGNEGNDADYPMPQGPFILSVGRLDYQKGFERIPAVAGELLKTHPAWSWVIVGDGCLRDKIRGEIEARGLQDRILLTGWKDPFFYYDRAAFCVMTSRYEGFGLVLLESLSRSCPVIAFDCKCGPSDIVRDGENGFLVPAENFALLKEKITLLMDSPDLRKKLADNAKASIRKFSVESFADRWNKLLFPEPEGVK